MIFLHPALALCLLQNTMNDKELISSYRIEYRSVIIFKHLPTNYSKIHYKPNFSKEQLPKKNHKPFGAFFPYGGLIKFDDPIPKEDMIVINIPHECRHIYISTLSSSFFRIGTPPSNVTFEKNLNLCLLSVGNPSQIKVKMNLESFSKLSFMSIDNSIVSRNVYNGNQTLIEHFDQSLLLLFQTSYFYLNNFVNISINQISNALKFEPHSVFISKTLLNGSFCLLLEDSNYDSHSYDTPNIAEDLVKPTFQHHQLKNNRQHNDNIFDDYHEDYKPSYNLGKNNDDFSDDDSFLIKNTAISVFVACGAIFIGCYSICYVLSYRVPNKKGANKKSNNGILLNEDNSFNNTVPPVISQYNQHYTQSHQYCRT